MYVVFAYDVVCLLHLISAPCAYRDARGTLISCLERSSQWPRALASFTAFDAVSCGAVLAACRRGTQWQQALHFLEMSRSL